MQTIQYSSHARQRCQQRGICTEVINLIADYGTIHYHEGAEIVFLEEKDLKFLSSELEIKKQLLDRCKGVYIVMAEGHVVTVCHMQRKFKRDYWH